MPKTEEQCKQMRSDMRNKILKMSSLYFARNGFGDTKISDLAKHIGIGQGTIYLYFKSKEELFEEIDSDEEFFVGDFKINSIPTSHDASDSVCYRFDDGEKSCAIVTDLGYYHDDIVDSLQDLNAILVEANHDLKMLEVGPYPYPLKMRIWGDEGHLSNEACGQLLSEIISDKMQYIILGHLSKDNNYPELAFETVRNELMFNDIDLNDMGIEIRVAKRDQPSCNIKL